MSHVLPTVSIVIPNFNRQVYLSQTLDSILRQTYNAWEALIVDDGSTDGSQDLVQHYCRKDPRFRLVQRSKEPKGAPSCRNIGLAQATGAYVIFLDSDDALAPYCLEYRVAAMAAHTDTDCVVFPMLLFQKQPGDSAALWSNFRGTEALTAFINQEAPWQTTGPIWRKTFLESMGGWDETALTWQDWEFHIRALLAGARYRMAEALPDCFLRRDDHDRISAGDMQVPRLKARLELFGKILSLLAKHHCLDTAAKKAFARLFFVHAARTAIKWPDEGLALHFANEIKAWELLGSTQYRQVRRYIGALSVTRRLRLRLLTTLLYKVRKRLFPPFLLSTGSSRAATISEADLKKVNELISL